MNKFIKKIASVAFTFVAAASLAVPTFAEESLPTEEEPILVDKENKTITLLAYVNGKYLETNTRHAIVFDDGNFGHKSIFGTKGNQDDFYEALKEIGAESGDNMTPENKEETQVEGDKINVTVTWDGAEKDYDINEVINDSNGNELDFRFGGNKERAHEVFNGCILCLDSCPVGLISNHTYTYGAVENRNEVNFTGNADVLPEEGTPVYITFSVKSEDDSDDQEKEDEEDAETEEAEDDDQEATKDEE